MKLKFYDVKTRQSVEAEVTEKKEYQVKGQTKYALRAKTSDGRMLTRFVKKEVYDTSGV